MVTTEIYSAGESNLVDITGQQLAEAIANHHPNVVFQPSLSDVSEFLATALEPGDLAIFLGAGNLNRVIPDLIDAYQQREQAQLE